MQSLQLLLIMFAALTSICRADLLQYSSQIPACGTLCILDSIPQSACLTLSNSTCVCTDQGLNALVTKCVLQRCTTEETLAIASVQDRACGRVIRSRRNDLWALIAVEVVTTVCIGLRMFSRWKQGTKYELDDYVMVVILLMFLAFTVLGQYARLTAFGVDIWTLDSQTITMGLKLFFVDETFYLAVLALSKVVVLCFYLRIFPNAWLRRSVYVVTAVIVVSTTILLFLEIFQCTPIQANWEGWKTKFADAKCLNVNLLIILAAALAIAEDLVILVLPLPIIFSLKLSWGKKAGIMFMFMFSLGAFVLLISCIRLRYIVMFQRTTNPTWDYVDTLIWTTLEVSVSIVVATLPAIRALLARSAPKLFGSTGSSTSQCRSSAPLGRTILSRAFPSKKGTRIHDNDDESQLELGDGNRGVTSTEIGAGFKLSHYDEHDKRLGRDGDQNKFDA